MSDQIFSLAKDEVFTLEKPSLIQDLFLGCGWENKLFHDTDIDLSALFFDKNGNKIKIASFSNCKQWLLDGSELQFVCWLIQGKPINMY